MCVCVCACVRVCLCVGYALHLLLLDSCDAVHTNAFSIILTTLSLYYNESVHRKEQHASGINTIP